MKTSIKKLLINIGITLAVIAVAVGLGILVGRLLLVNTAYKIDYLEFHKSNHGIYGDIDIMRSFIDKTLEYCNSYFENRRTFCEKVIPVNCAL